MVVAQPGSILGQSELPIHLAPSNHSMSPERKGEEDCELEAPCEELEGDSVSSEGGRMTDSTDDEETSSTESSHARKEEEVGSQVQRRLEIEQLKVMGRISQLEQEIRDLQLQRRELNIEVEMEIALLEGELRTERKKMEQEEELIGSLHGQLRETERRWQEEKEKDKLRLQVEKKKVQDLEQKISECRAQLDKQPESLREQLRKQIQEMMETMDTAVKSFDDLEFQQLETESSREEEREASYRQISQDISRQQNELNRRKDKVLRLEEQIRGAQDQAAADRRRISEENTKIFKSLNQEKERLLSLSALIGKDSEKQEKKEITPRKGLQRTSSLPRRRGNAPFVRPTDRPVSLNGSTCLESLGITLNLAVSSNNTNGKAGQSVSPSLEKARSPDIQGEERSGSKEGKSQNGLGRLSGTYGPLPKIAEIERQLREAMAEKERLLKAREEKRAAKEMKTRRLEMDQSQAKEQLPITSPATAQPATAEAAKEPVKVLSVPCSQTSVDLRAYLEASGHSVETCPQVRVSASCCRGYLVKMGGRIKTWKKRWFVFDRQKRRLAYYSDKEEQKLKGVIYFQAIEEVYYDHLRSAFKSPHPKLTFCLKTFERLFCMVAPTPEAMRIWMDVMVTAAEENSRY
ncbi:pleckstrin homology-like domain family B member 3 [Spea bombifrons]|uniref:pleckstrin homology-like domain family B member 3 n=1 Tax=Spea bombifrons TaxID=233779 RepID=UPI00234B5990|nr:pleckstrin homology-like domain family B member 3 [Spea bombifrons]